MMSLLDAGIGRPLMRAFHVQVPGMQRDAESGRFIDHARLKAKWEKRLALALDKAR